MFIDAGFDGGNIEVVSINDQAEVFLNTREDSNADHAQWFNVRLLGGKNQNIRFTVINAVHSSVHNRFNQERHAHSRDNFKPIRVAALAERRGLGAA